MTLSRSWGLFICAVSIATPAAAQDDGPTAAEAVEASRQRWSVGDPVDDLPVCDDTPPDADTIVVCRIVVDPETVMSVIPPPVDGDAGMPRAPDLRPPPCHPNALVCLTTKFGYVPPWPPMIDTTAFPEPLSAEDAAKVYALPDETDSAPAPSGERVPIPLED